MKTAFTFLWQLPQNLLGLGLLLLFGCKESFAYKNSKVCICGWIGSGGVSLGRYIFLGSMTATDICHEYGHCRQSAMLGPLYLLIGLWSAVRLGLHLYKRGDYYKSFPESWADRLGGVVWENGIRKAWL